MDHVQHRSVEKMVKMLERGLDPNFHDLDTGGRCQVERTSGSLAEARAHMRVQHLDFTWFLKVLSHPA